MSLSDTEYRTVVADPPWQPTMALVNGGASKASPQLHYDTLSVSEIIALRPRIATQAHLYIWCLTQHVDWGYEVARAWGGEANNIADVEEAGPWRWSVSVQHGACFGSASR